MNKNKLIWIAVLSFVTFLSACAQDENAATEVEGTEINTTSEDVDDYLVTIETPHGNMFAILYDETPKHKENFIKLANEGFYDSLLFHRVIKGFMIQGGDPKSKNAPVGAPLGQGGPGYTIPAEINANLFHIKGALSAARLGDQMNPERASSGSQFYVVQGKPVDPAMLPRVEAGINQDRKQKMVSAYIYRPENKPMLDSIISLQRTGNMALFNQLVAEVEQKALEGKTIPNFSYSAEVVNKYKTTGGTPHLDQQYTVFGHVIAGLEVIDKIAAVQTAQGDRPLTDVSMTVRVEKMKRSEITKRTGWNF